MNRYQLNLPMPTNGLNYADDILIGDNEAAEGTVNISFKDFMPQTRKGYIKQTLYAHTGESNEISRLAFHTVAGEKRLLFVDNGSTKTLYQLNEDKSPVRRSLGTVASSKPCFLQQPCAIGAAAYSEKVIVTDGNALRFFDEATELTAVTAYTPTADEITEYGTNVLSTTPDEINKQKWILNDDNRLWLAGYGNLVRVSHLGVAGAMPDYWPSTQAFKLKEDCTGMARFMGEVILFTENTATMVKGSTPVYTLDNYYKNEELPLGYGCTNHETIVIGENALYWANRTGVYRYRYQPSGFSIPECVSEFMLADGHTRTVKKKIDAISDWTKVFAVWHDHEYRLYIGGSEVLVFDSITSTWALFDYNLDFACGATYNGQLYYGGATAVETKFYIYHMDYPYNLAVDPWDGLSDDGVAFRATLKSKYFDFAKAANKKRFVKLWLTIYSDYVSYVLDVICNIDNEDAVYEDVIVNKITRWGNDNPADDDTEGDYAFVYGDRWNAGRTNLNYPIRIRHKRKKYNIQYSLTSDGLNQAWALKSAVLLLKMKEL